MSIDAAAPAKRQHSEKLWKEIETRACAGVGLKALSEAYGITIATINDRSKRHKWQTPARLARERKAALPAGKTESEGKNELRVQQQPGNLAASLAVTPSSGGRVTPCHGCQCGCPLPRGRVGLGRTPKIFAGISEPRF